MNGALGLDGVDGQYVAPLQMDINSVLAPNKERDTESAKEMLVLFVPEAHPKPNLLGAD